MGKYRSIVLPKISSPPTLQVVRDIMIQSQELPGSTVQIPFGKDGSEIYLLSITSARSESKYGWTLYRGETSDAPIEWSYDGDDAEKVFNFLTTRFPGWSQQSKLNTPEVQALKKQLRSNTMARSSQRSTLEGDLANMPVSNLLQSVAMNKMTGRLKIVDDSNEATVWFEDGAVVHCEIPGADGDEGLIELICWESGEFYFFPDNKIETRTVKKRLEILIMEGAIFHDLYTALKKLGFSFDCIVFRKNEALTETGYEATLAGGMPVDFDLQKQIYCELSPKTAFCDLMETLHLSRTQVVPIIFNLLSLDVVGLKHPTKQASAANDVPFGTDASDENLSAPVEESQESQLDWHKVKRKTDLANSSTNPESKSMDFVAKIREITGLDKPAQSNKKVALKGKSFFGLVLRNVFHPAILILMVVMMLLYFQAFRTSEIKAKIKNQNNTAKGVPQHGSKRYR